MASDARQAEAVIEGREHGGAGTESVRQSGAWPRDAHTPHRMLPAPAVSSAAQAWTRALAHRYNVSETKVLGSGAHGVVYEATDKWKGGRTVALKRVRYVFQELSEARNVVREVWLLARMSHENIIALVDVIATSESDAFMYFPFHITRTRPVVSTKPLRVQNNDLKQQIQHVEQKQKNERCSDCALPLACATSNQTRSASEPVSNATVPGTWYSAKSSEEKGSGYAVAGSKSAGLEVRSPSAPEHPRVANLYLVTELMDTDLRNVIRSDVKLSLQHVRFIMLQLLSAIAYLEARCVVHFDIKPGNILINENWDVKVADFGNSRVLHYKTQTFRPAHVVSRYYQPPEALLHEQCGLAVDIWAAGCVFAELLLRRVLFEGQSTQEQIVKIVQQLGSPSDEDVKGVRDPSNRRMLLSMPDYLPRAFDEALSALEYDSDGLNLLGQMLRFDPRRRISATEALAHPFFTKHFDGSSDLDSGIDTSGMTAVTSSGANFGELEMNDMFMDDCDSCLDSEPSSPFPRYGSGQSPDESLLVTCMNEDERRLDDAGVDTVREILDRELRAFSQPALTTSLLDSTIPDVLIGSLTSNIDLAET